MNPRQRELSIYLPESYDGGGFRYPVLYLLDAESDFLHTAGIVEFLGGPPFSTPR